MKQQTTIAQATISAILAGGSMPPARPKLPHPPMDADEERFIALVDAMVELNRDRRRQQPTDKGAYPQGAYAASFSTVRVYTGRGAGATSYIRERAKENDLVIVPSRMALDREYRPYRLPCRIVTPEELRPSRWMGNHTRYDTIYIDAPSHVLDQIPQDELYYRLTHDHQQTYILLGV